MHWLKWLLHSEYTAAESHFLRAESEVCVKINEDLATARAEAARLESLSDADFVAAVRRLEKDRPSWTDLIAWAEFIRRETSLRILLKGNENAPE